MHFRVTGYKAQEGIVNLEYAAPDIVAAKKQAISNGYKVISVQECRRARTLRYSRSHFSLALFSQELLGFLTAGLGLVEALDLLRNKARYAETRRVIESIVRELHEGRSLSKALEAQPDIFPPLYTATIRSSEQTGNVAQALERYLAYHRQLNLVKEKVTAASVYPALLAIVGILVILFLLGYVVPRFSQVYADMGNDLPWLSRVLMHWGQNFSENSVPMTISAVAILGLSIVGMCRESTRAYLESILWKFPSIGEKLRLYQLARFTRTLAMLVSGGIPFVTALGMVGELLRQPTLRAGLQNAEASIREGHSVSDAFSSYGLATEVGVRLISVGERSGNLGEALERIAHLYDEEIARSVDWFSRLFEPILMMGIGLIIGVIVLLMYMPIFELASSIQ